MYNSAFCKPKMPLGKMLWLLNSTLRLPRFSWLAGWPRIPKSKWTDQDSNNAFTRKNRQQSAGCSNFFEGFPRHRLDSMGWDPCAVFLDHLKDCLKTTVCDTCHILNASKRRQHIATAFLFYFLGCYVAKGAGIWRPATRLDHTGNGGFRLSGLPGRMALNIISQTYGCTAARVLSCSLRILEI